jgi:hypothetical protein
VVGGAEDCDGETEGGREVGGPETDEAQLDGIKKGGERLRRGGEKLSQMENTTHRGGNRAKVRVAAAAQTNDLAADTVLLSCKLQGHKVGRVEMVRGGRGVIDRQRPQKETDVTELKGLGIAGSARVLSGAEEKVKCQTNHVGAREVEGIL